MRGSFASHPPTWRKRKRGAAGGPRRNPRARGSSRLSGSPLEPLQRKIDESSRQLKRLEIRKFCANTRELERLNSKECGAVLAADAVNERTKDVFTLPTAAHFHCEKIPSIRFLIGKTFENGDFGLQCFSSRTKTFENGDFGLQCFSSRRKTFENRDF